MLFVQDGKLESITNAPATAQQAGAAPAGRPKSRAGKKRARMCTAVLLLSRQQRLALRIHKRSGQVRKSAHIQGTISTTTPAPRTC